MKDETGLKSKLWPFLKCPGFVPLRHEDVRTSGIPDLSYTGLGKTSWWEFKHATPDWSTSGIQELTCMRLAVSGICRYVFWHEVDDFRETRIYVPGKMQTPELAMPGFHFEQLAELMRSYHA